MFKSIISKFIFYFWVFFLIVTVPIYFFTTFQFKDIIKTSEQEKITLTLNTLKPMISMHLFFDQDKQLYELLSNMFEHSDIKSVRLKSTDGRELFFKSRKNINPKKLISYESSILDPVDKTQIATICLQYSNEHLMKYNKKIFIILISTFLFALVVFLSAYFYIRDDLITLRRIVDSLQGYSLNKDINLIATSSRSREISTIAKVANQMFVNIAQYVEELKSFNQELEKRVKEEIDKQQNQERMMIHQSRQAAMGEMLESIAHQWRQPLNIIGLATANLEMEHDLGIENDKSFHEKIEIISLNINYMSDTIDDFRNFLNPNRKMNSFDPNKSIKDVLTIHEAQLKNYKIRTDQKTDKEILFYGVENEFKQVMMILINNSKDAIKARIEKKIIHNGNINIILKKDLDKGIIELCDNGGGVKDEIVDSIFDPYFSTKFNAQGTGIGLYIAKNIIESRMQGTISVQNTESGCCFTITLPCVKNLIRE